MRNFTWTIVLTWLLILTVGCETSSNSTASKSVPSTSGASTVTLEGSGN